VDQNFGYTSNIAGSELTCTADTTPASFTLNDDAGVDNATNTEDCTNVPAGNYTVTEGADPSGFKFTDHSCTATGTGTSATPASGDATRTATITMAGGGSVTCVYTNTQQLGAIQVTKTRKHAADGPGDHPHAGVTFTVNQGATQIASGVTAANGKVCFDNLAFGAYTVHENVPLGYHLASPGNDRSVTVDNNAKCTDNPYGGESVPEFHNTPLTNLTASVDSQVDGGTGSTITCVNAANETVASGTAPAGPPPANGDGSATATGLEPGTYTCTVVIDP
jgi:uncharacterized surface anchored protein